MIKLTFCLRRKEGMTLDEFQAYWYEQHAPLVKSHAETLRIRRYVQTHALDTPVNEALAESRSASPRFDGIAELWWDSLEDLTAALDDPAGQAAGAALLEDEAKFIDLANSPLWVNEEKSVVG